MAKKKKEIVEEVVVPQESGDVYFAKEPTDKIGALIMDKIDKYYTAVQASGRLDLWKKLANQYYKGYDFKGMIPKVGVNKNLRKISVNHFKNILQYMHVMTSNQRPAFEPRSTNSDYKSYAQTTLAKGLLDYYMSVKKVEDHINKALEFSILFGEGYIYPEWNTSLGEAVGETVKNGDLDFSTYHPLEVPRELGRTKADENDWLVLVRYVSKFELAARYPSWSDDIRGLSGKDTEAYKRRINFEYASQNIGNDTIIPFYTFLHKKTAILPKGRMVHMCADNIVMFDGDLPYKDFPVVILIPEGQEGTPFGYTVSFDMLPIQLGIDGLNSTILSNQLNFGVQNILSPKGCGVTANDSTEGSKFIEYNSSIGKPEPMQLTHTAPEIFTFAKNLVADLETISGVNSVSRGNPEASLKSGAALALVHSTALMFSRGLQRSYISCLESLGTMIINILKQYATTPRVALITGISNQAYLQEFIGDDISDINRVIVDSGNPLTRTTAGKQNMADILLQNQLISSPEQYMQVATTGNLDPIYGGPHAEMMLIKKENEMMTKGKQPRVLITDKHKLHITEHKVVLASTEARDESAQEVVNAVIDHLEEHILALKQGNPELLMALGEQPLQGAPQAPAQPPKGDMSGAQQPQPNEGTEPLSQAAMPNMPSLPSPNGGLEKQKYNPATGQ